MAPHAPYSYAYAAGTGRPPPYPGSSYPLTQLPSPTPPQSGVDFPDSSRSGVGRAHQQAQLAHQQRLSSSHHPQSSASGPSPSARQPWQHNPLPYAMPQAYNRKAFAQQQRGDDAANQQQLEEMRRDRPASAYAAADGQWQKQRQRKSLPSAASDHRPAQLLASDEDDELDPGGGEEEARSPQAAGAAGSSKRPGGKMTKRKRVVVACDTCRRKKVKCEGLPNPTNTCKNCENMGYTCVFTVEPDRSRGRYEILESQRDTLLVALRSVAPELADHFERGELHIANPSGSLLRRPDTGGQDDIRQGEKEELTYPIKQRSPERQGPSADNPFEIQQRDLGPMVPDLEDGRPRYYGGSSSLRSFNELESRPSSPGLGGGSRRVADNASSAEGTMATSTEGREIGSDERSGSHGNSMSGSKSRFAVLPPPMPLFPSNSIDWVREMRRKTLVAIGRDEIFANEGWFNRHPLPEASLLNDMLDYYFRQLNPMLPILHEATLRRDIAQGRADRDSAFRGLVFTLLAIAGRFAKDDKRVLADPDDAESAGDHWAAASRFHHQVYAASLINVQMLILACAFMPSTLGIGTSWTVLGVAIRALQDIGLHTEKAYGGYTPFDQERRRRTFWAAVIIDGLLSINMGRPTAVRLADTSVYYPRHCTEEALSEAERTGAPVEELPPGSTTPCISAGFIHLIKAGTIIRDVVDTLYAPAAVQLSSASKVVPSYKDMTILSKRLDEWSAEVPVFLRDVRTSPFPAQACYVIVGRNNIRLYILKPFLYDFKASFPSVASGRTGSGSQEDGSILRKMLLPQCTRHARSSLWALKNLHEDVGVPLYFFILHQGFLSASTFLMTVWHGTRDIETLCEDRDIVEFGLRVFNAEARFATILLKRAHRILRNIALRMLPAVQDAAQRRRLQDLLRQNGSAVPLAPATLRAAADGAPRTSWTPPDTQVSAKRGVLGGDALSARLDGKNMQSNTPGGSIGETFLTGPAMTTMAMMTPRLQNGTPLSESRRFPHTSSPVGVAREEAAADQVALAHPQQQAMANVGGDFVPATGAAASPRTLGFNTSMGPHGDISHTLDSLDVRQWLPVSDNDGAVPAVPYESNDLRGGFEFTGDLSWTDYFSRFLGGLPDPSLGAPVRIGGADGGSVTAASPSTVGLGTPSYATTSPRDPHDPKFATSNSGPEMSAQDNRLTGGNGGVGAAPAAHSERASAPSVR